MEQTIVIVEIILIAVIVGLIIMFAYTLYHTDRISVLKEKNQELSTELSEEKLRLRAMTEMYEKADADYRELLDRKTKRIMDKYKRIGAVRGVN